MGITAKFTAKPKGPGVQVQCTNVGYEVTTRFYAPILQVLVSGVIVVSLSAAQTSTVPSPEYRCETCHPNQSRPQPATAMAQAAAPAIEAQILKDHPTMRFASGGYTYAIAREADRVTYLVSDGDKTFSAPILWAFGFGSIGQTYLYSYRGELYESKVSFYPPINGLDITIGQGRRKPASAEDAAGRLLSKPEMTRCFGCHTTGSPDQAKAGVQCERCHENAQQHARASSTRTGPSIAPLKLSQLSKEGLSEFCGGCHRTLQEIVALRTLNINNVRSQPYRLGTSKCFRATQDKRISCVACHDPHEDMVKDSKYYDAKCQACHQTGTAASAVKPCPVAKQGCVSCHMPKVDFPDGHSRFTDHRIRVVRPGAAFPG